jgi:hypothetical protein
VYRWSTQGSGLVVGNVRRVEQLHPQWYVGPWASSEEQEHHWHQMGLPQQRRWAWSAGAQQRKTCGQGYSQVEGLDFGETFALVARLEAIWLLLAYSSLNDIKLYQMDMKSVFLNDEINELVYVEQPPGFEDPRNPNHVYRLKKALYGLKQAPRAWYERLSGFLVKQGFKRGMVDTTLFTKEIDGDLFICQIYVDDIIFGSTNDALSHEFATMMSREFKMFMIRELNFFLGF